MTSLASVHTHFAELAAKMPGDVQDCFEESLGTFSAAREALEAARNELGKVEPALRLVLQFLDAAHDTPVMGDPLHCLLQPLHGRLEGCLSRLDRLL